MKLGKEVLEGYREGGEGNECGWMGSCFIVYMYTFFKEFSKD